jgi:hypothetical protein
MHNQLALRGAQKEAQIIVEIDKISDGIKLGLRHGVRAFAFRLCFWSVRVMGCAWRWFPVGGGDLSDFGN